MSNKEKEQVNIVWSKLEQGDLTLDKLSPYGTDNWFLFPTEENLEDCDFLLELTKKERHFVEFKIHEVTTWSLDDRSQMDHEEYMSVLVKWDGCSHVNFGDAGYVHLCGLRDWMKHAKVVMKAFQFARDNIDNWDPEIAE